MSRGRPFGSIRRLPSRRYQARYIGPDGLRRTAPRTFPTVADARRFLALVEVEIAKGEWEDIHFDGEQFGSYAKRWITERPGLAATTIRLYSGLLRLHLEPHFGGTGIRRITPPDVRTWRQTLLDNGTGPSTVAKSYRLMKAVMSTAYDDELIRRNPCRIRGAGEEHPEERPILTLAQVMDLAKAIEPRYRLLVLLAVFASMRWGELMALRKTDFDLVTGLVRIDKSIVLIGAEQVVKRPKTAAGVRTVAVPMWLIPLIEAHFRDYSALEADGAVFVGPYGKPPARPNFSPIWAKAIGTAKLPSIHFHDLRHTGNHFAALSGATTRELMGRMGHASMNAALIYQHRTASRDRAIADALDQMVEVWSAGRPGLKQSPGPPEIAGRPGGGPQIIRGFSVRVLPDPPSDTDSSC